MTEASSRHLIVADGRVWTPTDWAFDAVLGRIAARACEQDSLRMLDAARRLGVADLRELEQSALVMLLEAAHTAFVRLVRVWRIGFPDEGHDELVQHTGSLIRLLEEAVPQPFESWSVRRLEAFGGAVDVCFPTELERVVGPLLQHDLALLERVLGALRDRDLGEAVSALTAAAFLPSERRDAFFRDSARHRHEAVRLALFGLLTRGRRLPDPGSLTAALAPDADEAILRAGVLDPSPRVRERAIAYAYGLGRVAWLQTELAHLLDAPDPDEDVRGYALLALGLVGDPATLALLMRAFERGTPTEINAAVWALARRPDGVARVVAAVEDPRPEVRPEAIGAIMHVAGALSDDQLTWLSAPARAPEVRHAVDHHRRRDGVADPARRVQVTWRSR